MREANALSQFQIAIIAMAAVVAISIVVAATRMSQDAVDAAVAQREAADRYLARELYVLRVMAMTAKTAVPGRLYLGIEDCFKRRAAVPLEDERAAGQVLSECAETELGRLQAQGGDPMALEGRGVLKKAGLLVMP